MGFGVGGLTVPFDILAEFLPTEGRGTNLLCIEYFWTVGCLYVVGVAYILQNQSWRIFVALCTLPCLLSLIMGILYVPESPRWLAEQEGRLEEAREGLYAAAVANGRTPSFLLEAPVEGHGHGNASVMDLFQPRWRKTILLLWSTWGVSAFGYYGTIMTITRVFESDDDVSPLPSNSTLSADHHPADTGTGETFDFSAIFISNAAEVVGVTFVIFGVDRIGRIPSQVVSYALSGFFLGALCYWASIHASRPLLIALGFCARVFVMSATCVTWVSTAEILSTEVRTTGHAIANALAKVGAVLCPYVVEGNLPLQIVGVVLLFVQLFASVCVSQLPETAGRELGAAPSESVETSEQAAEDRAALVVDEDDDEPLPHNGELA